MGGRAPPGGGQGWFCSGEKHELGLPRLQTSGETCQGSHPSELEVEVPETPHRLLIAAKAAEAGLVPWLSACGH